MNITLDRVSIQNFKGIKDLSVNFQGKSAAIYGKNATGKTSIYDAFLWLLFNKDSTGRTDFSYKPQENGQDVHFLNTSVEAILNADGKTFTFHKVSSEKWSTKRGQEEQEYGGNVISYFVDDIPRSQAEFKAAIASLMDEQTFRLITNPFYMNIGLKPMERRERLFAMTAVLSDKEIMGMSPDFEGLTLTHKLDDEKKLAKSRIAKLNEEKEKIPPRIDELMRGIKDTVNPETLDNESKHLLGKINRIDLALNGYAKEAGAYHQKEQQLSQLRQKVSERIDELKTGASKEQVQAKARLETINANIQQRNQAIDNKQKLIADRQKVIEEKQKQQGALQIEYKAIKIDEYVSKSSNADFLCPTCKQPYPLERFKEIQEKAKTAFIEDKTHRLEQIAEKSKIITGQIALLKEQQANDSATIQAQEQAIKDLNEEGAELKDTANSPEAVPDIAHDSVYIGLMTDISALMDETANPPEDKTPELLIEKAGLQKQLDEIKGKRQEYDRIQKDKARIEELKAEQKRLAQEKAKQEKMLFKLEQFETFKCNLVEQSINTLFPTVRWKLFNRQINGGIEPTCECLIDGVPFVDANHAAQITSGLEIIDVLCRHYEVSAPLFIDNAEAVNELPKIGSQTIALYVTEDQALKIEVEG